MQTIILAAGMGKRLGKLTQNNTKCMVEVNGIKLIDRFLTQLSKLDLSRIIIVVGYEGNKLINYINSNYKGKTKIEFVSNNIYDRTNNIYSLALVKDKLIEDDTILLESDLIFEDSILLQLVNSPYPNLAAVAKYEEWMDGTMVCIDSENNILNFIPKKAFNYNSISQYYKTINIYKFSKEFSQKKYVPFLEAYNKVMGNNEYYEQVLRVLTFLDKTGLKAMPINDEKWYEIDDIQDLDIAETIFAPENVKLEKYHSRYGGFWRFHNLLDYCYLVNPYFPTEKMKNEMKSSFDKLLTEYPSGMYVNSLLAGKYFKISSEYICVGNGAAELIKSLMENQIKGKVGIVYPTFEEYPNRLDPERIIQYIPNNKDFKYGEEDIFDFFKEKNISTLLLINPDNPSGNFIKRQNILNIINWCKEKHITIIIDESFVDFTDDYTNNSLLNDKILENNPNLFVIKSISKSYGVPGLRLGIIASGNTEAICKIKKDVSIWNINSFAEFYMQIFGKYEKEYNASCDKFIEERNRFFKDLKNIPWLRVIPSQANYFLCELTNMYTASELSKILLCKFNILIKDCGTKKAFKDNNYIRIAIRDRNDNIKLYNALKELS